MTNVKIKIMGTSIIIAFTSFLLGIVFCGFIIEYQDKDYKNSIVTLVVTFILLCLVIAEIILL